MTPPVALRHVLEGGGTDEGANLYAQCKPCHLPLIHSGRLVVERKGDLRTDVTAARIQAPSL